MLDFKIRHKGKKYYSILQEKNQLFIISSKKNKKIKLFYKKSV